MLLDKLVEDDGVLVAASQEGYEEAKLTALKACLMRGKKDEDRCEEITRFGDTCFAVAEGRVGMLAATYSLQPKATAGVRQK